MFKISTKYSLSQEDNRNYNDITYDGSKTYLCTDNKQILILDETRAFVESIPTHYSYHTLCYDNSNNCFWAASEESPDVIFKLSHTLEEVAEIELSIPEHDPPAIHALFYDAASRYLLAAQDNKIYAINPTGKLQLFFELKDLTDTPIKIFTLSDRYMCLTQCESQVHLKQFSRVNGKALDDQVLSGIDQINSFAASQIHLPHPDFSLLLLAKEQDCSPCLVELKQEPSDIQMQQLSKNFMRCPFWVGSPGQANTNRPYPRFPDNIPLNTPFNNSCNPPYPPTPPCPDCCEDGCSCCDPCCRPPLCHHQACTQVIESVALTEASIAHILNAEGEKLQKAIACCSSINDLLKVNESVLRTIIHSTQLEQMLFYKLDSVLREENCNCQICHHPCHNPCHAQNANSLDEDKSENEF